MAAPAPPSGRTIVLELQREMETRLYPLMYRTLPPGVFHIYLHPDDHALVAPIVPAIVTDAQQALNDRVDALNRRGRWKTLVSGGEAPIEVPPAGWDIQIHPDPNGELVRGELGIESRLSIPPPPRYDGGQATTRIARTVVTGTIRRTTSEPEASAGPLPIAAAAGPPAPAGREASAGADVRVDPPSPAVAVASAPHPTETAPAAAAVSPGGRTAQLTYVDETGPHAVVIRKDLISIGRGGSAHWVDVQIVGSPRVSREHCRIRRSADHRYFLQDVSTWGTSVDGTPVARYAADAQAGGPAREYELGTSARIQLADAVVLEFSVQD